LPVVTSTIDDATSTPACCAETTVPAGIGDASDVVTCPETVPETTVSTRRRVGRRL
jgi:hypothetical protein